MREVLGIEQLLGLRKCMSDVDGQTRLRRVLGSEKSMWVMGGDAVIVEPWEYDSEKATSSVPGGQAGLKKGF